VVGRAGGLAVDSGVAVSVVLAAADQGAAAQEDRGRQSRAL